MFERQEGSSGQDGIRFSCLNSRNDWEGWVTDNQDCVGGGKVKERDRESGRVR